MDTRNQIANAVINSFKLLVIVLYLPVLYLTD